MTLELDRPEAGDKILQKWARDLITILRNHRLASNEFFDIKTDVNGTTIRLKKYKKKRKITIALSGVPSRYYACRKLNGNSGSETEQIENIEVQVFPLGYAPTTQTFAKKEDVPPEEQVEPRIIAYANEMIDSEPIYNGNFIIAANTTTYFTIEIEEEEEDG